MTGVGEMLLPAAGAFLLVALGMVPGLSVLGRLNAVDVPNERSSHHVPTPIGGGIIVIPVVLGFWLIIGGSGVLPVTVAALFLAGLSFADDLKSLPTLIRLAGHTIAVVAILALDPGLLKPAAEFLPQEVAFVATVLVWVWFLNLFNFMDGIDGITGVETLTIGAGVAGVAGLSTVSGDVSGLGLVLAGAALGFLVWNWHPAKVFLGDVGSVPLGFLLGWLLLALAAQGAWAATLILPAYYLFDATLTLVKRAFRGEKVWRAHRSHFYQQAVLAGLSHGEVSGFLFAGNLILVLLAAASVTGDPVICLGGAAAICLGLGLLFGRPARLSET